MSALTYKTGAFEGPLDLLLHLIAQHKLDIYDINIFELVTQYTDYINMMREEDMDISSEFLEMAARLVYIKSVSLLPKYEEAEKLREELTGQLIEYRDCKLIAAELSGMTGGFDKFVREPEPIPADMTYNRFHDPLELITAYLNAAGKRLTRLPPPEDSFADIVKKAVVSVESRIKNISFLLRRTGRIKLDILFSESKTRSELVASFLAVLEMARDGRIRLNGTLAAMTAEYSENLS
ncbi:MAG: segregation/condensation protein A [Clostridia bacterium]|nr:segregation/condensation protein A [Clostridia bacterium]